jgi:hypothetical protein
VHQWLLAPLGDIEAVIPLSHHGQDMATFPEGKLTQLFEGFFDQYPAAASPKVLCCPTALHCTQAQDEQRGSLRIRKGVRA